MRRCIVRDALVEAGADTTCAVLAEVERRPPGGDRVVMDRLRETLRDVLLATDAESALPYTLRRDACASARRAQDDTVMGDTTRSEAPGLKNWELEGLFNQDYAAGEVDATLFAAGKYRGRKQQ